MKLPRKDLLEVLRTVAPALSSNKNQVEQLCCVWFSGEEVSTFNDILGIKITLKTDFQGGIKGDKLLGILENSRARDVTLERADDNNLLLKAGSAHVKFATMPISEWWFKPKIPKADPFLVSKDFLEAIKLVLISVGSGKVLSAEQRGITVIQNGGAADLYSTDAVRISWMKVATKNQPVLAKGDRAVIPTPFCEQVIKLAAKGAEIVVDADAAYYRGAVKIGEVDSDVLLFAKLVEEDQPVPFEDTVQDHIKTKGRFPVPGRLMMALDRASIMLSSGEPADFKVEDGVLNITVQNTSGEIDDEIELTDAGKHPNITVKADPGLIKAALDGRDYMAVTAECVVMTGPKGFYHIISTK